MSAQSTAVAQAASNPPADAARDESKLMSSANSLVARVANRYGVDPEKMLNTMRMTCFRSKSKDKDKPAPPITNEQLMALLVVADQYKLNPWTREIYAFPQDGGIVPIVGVDGWIRMINEHPAFDGMQFTDGPLLQALDPKTGEPTGVPVNEWIECVIHRKDRTHPTIVREYIIECRRPTGPWNEMPRRMLRHKALMQCARIAFGFAGIFDEDDATVITQDEMKISERRQLPSGRINHRSANIVTKQADPAAKDPMVRFPIDESAVKNDLEPEKLAGYRTVQEVEPSEEDFIKADEVIDNANSLLADSCPSIAAIEEAIKLITRYTHVINEGDSVALIDALTKRRSEIQNGSTDESIRPSRKARTSPLF